MTTPDTNSLGELGSRRPDFLLAMYKAVWDNINRHILVVWQSVATLIATLGASFVVARNGGSPDLSWTLVCIACAWCVAHSIDANGWFNRNLLLIANIERQFLRHRDAQEIHYFFDRPHKSSWLDHLRIQAALAISIWVVGLTFHFVERVWPGRSAPISHFELPRALPYFATLAALAFVLALGLKTTKRQKELITKSPGAAVTASAATQTKV